LVNGRKSTETKTTVMNEFNQISMEKLENALNSSGNRKVPGVDNKYGVTEIREPEAKIRMLQLFNDMECWKNTRRMENGIIT
jgi:hypothetical protein